MSDKNFNEWLFSDIDDLIDCDYSDESEAETRMTDNEIFGTEIKCINRRANGKCNGGTDCCKCDLLMNEKDIISAYERAIANSNLINRLQAEIERLKECPKCIYEYDKQGYLLLINNAPGIEIVRCKECKYWDAVKNPKCKGVGICAPPRKDLGGYCARRGATNGEDFCSYGERKDEE